LASKETTAKEPTTTTIGATIARAACRPDLAGTADVKQDSRPSSRTKESEIWKFKFKEKEKGGLVSQPEVVLSTPSSLAHMLVMSRLHTRVDDTQDLRLLTVLGW